jgi:hypothetical protein
MDRISQTTLSGHKPASAVCHIDIGAQIHSAWLPSSAQRGVPNIRTDLDSFSDLEISALIKQGYIVAENCLRQQNLIGQHPTGNVWNRVVQNFTLDANALKISEVKRRRLGLLNWRDPVTWLCLALLILYIPVPPTILLLHWKGYLRELSAGKITGRVLDTDGRPIHGARVTERTWAFRNIAYTDEFGTCVFRLLPAKYDAGINIEKDGYESNWFSVGKQADGYFQVTIRRSGSKLTDH